MHQIKNIYEIVSVLPKTTDILSSYYLALLLGTATFISFNYHLARTKFLTFTAKTGIFLGEMIAEAYFLHDQTTKLNPPGIAGGFLILASSLTGLAIASNRKIH